jgi:hypothetical protein
VQNIRQLEAALHREWKPLSQLDIRRLTGEMRRMVETIIQVRIGYTLGSWLAKKHKSRLRFGGRRLLLLNDEIIHVHRPCS